MRFHYCMTTGIILIFLHFGASMQLLLLVLKHVCSNLLDVTWID